MKKILLGLLIAFSSCTVQKIYQSLKKSEVFDQGHLGFMLVDPEKDKPLVEINSDKYFIPASNTKLFTFYTSYAILGDGLVNGINYLERGDSLIFWGTGDPSLLHPDLKNDRVIEFLKNSDKKLYLLNNFNQVEAFGPGWSWDWFPYYYAAERSAFPVYGNIVRFSKSKGESSFRTYPSRFESNLVNTPPTGAWDYSFNRNQDKNEFPYFLKSEANLKEFEVDIPYITSPELTAEMLKEAVGKNVTLISIPPTFPKIPKNSSRHPPTASTLK